MREPTNQISDIRWLPCVNNSGSEAIPAFAAVRVVSSDTAGVLTVGKPNADSQDVLINGPIAIPASGKGICTPDAPIYALYETGDSTPALDEAWGAGSGSYKLRKGKTGFKANGGEVSGRSYFRRPGSASGSTSPLTTKGDIYTYSTIDARLPIGTDGQILVADSSQVTGQKWKSLTGTGGAGALGGQAVDLSGTSTAVYTDVIDFNPGAPLIGSLGLKNTGGTNSLRYRVEGTDIWGNTTIGGGAFGFTVTPGTINSVSDNLGASIGGGLSPPLVRVRVQVIDNSAGSHTTFRLAGLLVNG